MSNVSDDEIADILLRKNQFFEDRKRSLGTEYYSNRDFWNRMWQTEWEMLNERLADKENEIEIEPLPITFPKLEFEKEELNLYSFEDFCLLHNQGIFRDTKFIIDRRGKWTKKVIEEMKTYGYAHIKTIGREKMLVMKWKTK